MVKGDLIRFKHNGKLGVILRIDNSRRDLARHGGEADTHLVLGVDPFSRSKRKFVSPEWIERVESD